MKILITPTSQQGQIQKDYCRNANNRIRNTFEWKIDVTNTKTGIFSSFSSDPDKGEYALQIRTLTNCDNYAFSICDIQSSDSSKISVNPDKTININGNASVTFNVVCEIDANKINDKETKYEIILKKVETSGNDITSGVFGFSLTTEKELCRICKNPHNLGICRLEPKAIEYIGDQCVSDVEVADIVISSLPNATANDIIRLLYTEENIQVNYGNVPCSCYLYLGSADGASNIIITEGVTEVTIPTDGEIRIPIRVQQLPRPNGNTQELTVSADVQYTSCRHQEAYHTMTASVPYRMSSKANELKLTIDDPAEIEKKDVTNLNEDSKKVTVTPPATYTITLNIENEALQAVGADCGIHVRNIKRTVLNSQELAGRFENAGFDPAKEWNLSIDDTYLIHSANEQIATLPGASNTARARHIAIPLFVNSSDIQNIVIKDHNRTADVKMKLEFDYKVDQLAIDSVNNSIIAATNDNAGYIHHEFYFTMVLERSYITEWHALDFGTSAVVNIKSANGWSREIISNLKQKKGILLGNIYPTDDAKIVDTGEEDAPNLIASTLYINPAADEIPAEESGSSVGTAQQYFRSKLWFSPSTGMVNPSNRLPCVKNMIGNQRLPNIPGVDCNSLDVGQVVSTAYEQLCKIYLSDENIEGLILTVPNSFTPLHIKSIREIVMEQISSLTNETLNFVSESDAVLWSYIKKTRQTLPNFIQELSNQKKNKEHILIFDMGAGTLDITYAECTDEIVNGEFKCSIDIKSRIGVNKAGNYIDYLIGEIILKIMGNKGVTPAQWNRFARTLSITGAHADHREKKDLREYLRNKVKVMLGNPGMVLPPVNPNAPDGEKYKLFNDCDSYEILGEIKVGEILEDQLFKDFIESCTQKLMQELAQKQGSITMDPNRLIQKFILDTVILSGRTTSLPAISQSLKESFKKYTCTDSENFQLREVIKGLNDINEESEILYLEPKTNDRKTVVALGALDFRQLTQYSKSYRITSNKRIYGSYGLLYKFGNNVIGWKTLVGEENYMQDGIHDIANNSYSTQTVVNTAGISKILLCHTYNTDPMQAAIDGNYDSITILHEYNVLAVSNNVIKIEITDEREINYFFNGQKLILQPHDDYANEALRKSLWPVVYRN